MLSVCKSKKNEKSEAIRYDACYVHNGEKGFM